MKIIHTNEHGCRIGEDHQKAKYSDHEVGLVIQLREDALSYDKIGVIMEMPKSTVRDICVGRCRAQTAVHVKIIEMG